MRSRQITAERARSLLRYDPLTGELTWIARSSPASRVLIGSRAGTRHKDGYLSVWIDGVAHLGHLLVWLMEYGRWPVGEIDHKDGNGLNNRLSNLRDVTHETNMQNQRRAHSGSKSGLLGAHWRQSSGRWASAIRHGRRRVFLGLFDSAEGAHATYMSAKSKYHTSAGGDA